MAYSLHLSAHIAVEIRIPDQSKKSSPNNTQEKTTPLDLDEINEEDETKIRPWNTTFSGNRYVASGMTLAYILLMIINGTIMVQLE